MIVDGSGRPLAWPSLEQLSRAQQLPSRLDPDLPIVGEDATLEDALNTMLVSRVGAGLVVGARGRFEGVVDLDAVMESLQSQRTATGSGAAPVGSNDADIRVSRDDDTGEIRVITEEDPDGGSSAAEPEEARR